MERSKGIILIVVCLAAILIIWQVGFQKTEEPTTTPSGESTSDSSNQPTTNRDSQNPRDRSGRRSANADANAPSTNRIPATATSAEVSNMKIAIPDDINDTELELLYAEYRQISSSVFGMSGRGSRGGRTDRMGGGRGGMMDMFRGGDPTEMMNNMMEMMGGGRQ